MVTSLLSPPGGSITHALYPRLWMQFFVTAISRLTVALELATFASNKNKYQKLVQKAQRKRPNIQDKNKPYGFISLNSVIPSVPPPSTHPARVVETSPCVSHKSQSLVGLPPELLLIIFKSQGTIADVLHLGSTCQYFHGIWQSDFDFIVDVVLPRRPPAIPTLYAWLRRKGHLNCSGPKGPMGAVMVALCDLTNYYTIIVNIMCPSSVIRPDPFASTSHKRSRSQLGLLAWNRILPLWPC